MNPQESSQAFYDSFYARGGWKYNLAAEKEILALIAKIAGWQPGEHIIEIGAGMGHHSELLRQAGYKVTALEQSPVACVAAQELYPDLRVVCSSVSTWRPRRKLQHVFARGMSFYHYELSGLNRKGIDAPEETARMMRWILAGGTFVLQIITDLSGHTATPMVHNTPDAYRHLFTSHGAVAVYNWSGQPIAQRPDRGVIVVTRRPGRRRRL